MRFSERIGITKAKDALQIDQMDEALRNGLWNAFHSSYLMKIKSDKLSSTEYNSFFKAIWANFFKLTLDTLSNWTAATRDDLRRWFFDAYWFEVYDFLDFISNTPSPSDVQEFRTQCNIVLEEELSGYRFINGILAPITNAIEIGEIDEAITNSTSLRLIGVTTHLESALNMLSDKKNPDYRNSIKESISAIESIAKVISNNSKDSLGSALDKIKGKIKLHQSLERGFKQIYGYTSDADGIRHALMEESTCDFEDAKYILVSSSAFVNYLITKADKANIEI